MRHWKVLITTFAILGIVALLLVRFGSQIGGLEPLSSLIAKFNPTPRANPFPIEISTSIDNFDGISLNVANITLDVNSACTFTKPPNNIDFERKNGICIFSTGATSGKLSFSNGVVTVDTDDVAAQISPDDIFIGGLQANSLSLLKVDGNLKIFQNSTWVSLPLQQQDVSMTGFAGNMLIGNGTATMDGLVVAIQGSGGNGPGFKWSG